MLLCSTGEIRAHGIAIGSVVSASDIQNVGAFVYVNRPRAKDLAVQLRIRDISRGHSWGTEVPIVRGRDMRLGRTHLMDVPVTAGFQQHLRIYGASSPSGAG